MSQQPTAVTHQPEQNQFTIDLKGGTAVMAYELDKDGTMMIMHTEVPEAHTGQGYATQLAHEAMEYAKQEGIKVMPYCTYMATFLKRHKAQYKDLVSPEFTL